MALRPILCFPHARLRLTAAPVVQFDAQLVTLVTDMYETMYASQGIGLAATQIDVQFAVITMDLSEQHDQPLTLINASIVEQDGLQRHEEGCLSLPGIYAEVQRAKDIRVKSFDMQGVAHEFDATGLLAVCIQHELDHLHGKVFIDHLSTLKRERLLKKANKHCKTVM